MSSTSALPLAAHISQLKSSADWVERLAAVECPAFTARRRRRGEETGIEHDPIVWSAARGVHVWDVDKKKYVDLSAGFGVASVGHAHPRVVKAIRSQSKRLLHALGDVHPSDVKIRLLERIANLTPWRDAQVVLSLNGADAVTTALKTAALKTRRAGVVAFEGGYHGLEYAPLAACGFDARFREPFADQLNPHVKFLPWPKDMSTWQRAVDEIAWHEIGAMLIEVIQARGGVRQLPHEALHILRKRCDQSGALLIADEIYTGLGRVGARWSFEASGIVPDVICMGKALGGGLPVSACVAPESIMHAWDSPAHLAIHTGTFYGNPLGCAAALTVLDVMEKERLMQRALDLGQYFREIWPETHTSLIRELRVFGLLIGIELANQRLAVQMNHALLQRGYLTLIAGTNASVIQLSPPLVVSKSVLKKFVDVFFKELEKLA